MIISVAKDLNERVHVGVYQCQSGPCFETIAEQKLAMILGVDALGMSTTYEGNFVNLFVLEVQRSLVHSSLKRAFRKLECIISLISNIKFWLICLSCVFIFRIYKLIINNLNESI